MRRENQPLMKRWVLFTILTVIAILLFVNISWTAFNFTSVMSKTGLFSNLLLGLSMASKEKMKWKLTQLPLKSITYSHLKWGNFMSFIEWSSSLKSLNCGRNWHNTSIYLESKSEMVQGYEAHVNRSRILLINSSQELYLNTLLHLDSLTC